MHCPTTLEQLSELLGENGSPTVDAAIDGSLHQHVERCGDCRRRLDRLTDDPILAQATRRFVAREKETVSPVLRQALDAVESLGSPGGDTTGDKPGDKPGNKPGNKHSNKHSETIADSHANDLSRLLDPPEQPSDLGTVGRYQVQAILGRGGMSVVFAAWDELLQRRVAIKVFDTHQDDRTWKRFVREARAAARIEHPSVVPVYEVIERVGKPPALVMPLMSDGTLQQQLGRQILSPQRAAEITLRIAGGLSVVHRQGHVHRDIKPANILFDDEGQAKLSDFGLVRRDQDEPLTEADVLPGTPEYIAPEMLLGSTPAGAASDIYQLGLTLYAMLTGVCAYQGSVRGVLRQIMEGPPPHPSKYATGIPKDLETICLKAIERQPTERYRSADEMAADLDRYLCGEPISARRPSLASRIRRIAKRWPVTTAIAGVALPCVVLLAAGYGVYQQQREQFQHQQKLFQEQQEAGREQIADQTHRADVAELRSEQVLSQSLSAVFAAKQLREPDWVDTEKMLLNALLGGLEQGFEQMRLAPERNANFGEMALSLAKLRCRVDRTDDALEVYRLAIQDFDGRLSDKPTEQLWQLQTGALRDYGNACTKLGDTDSATQHLKRACEIAGQQSQIYPESLKWKLETALSETEYGHALLAAADADRAAARFDDAAKRIEAIAQADGPLFNLVGFRELFADGISRLATGYRDLRRFDEAMSHQQLAVVQNDRLGEDELSRVRQADCRAVMAEILADAGRPSDAAAELRGSLESLEQAMKKSGQPERYKKRRHQWQQRAAELDDSPL